MSKDLVKAGESGNGEGEGEQFLDFVRRLATQEAVDWNSPEAISRARVEKMIGELKDNDLWVNYKDGRERVVHHDDKHNIVENDNSARFSDLIKPYDVKNISMTEYTLNNKSGNSPSREILNESIRIQKIINAWYIAFNQALNVPDKAQRLDSIRRAMIALRGMKIPEKVGSADGIALYGALSILLTEDQQVGTLARARAMEAAAEIVEINGMNVNDHEKFFITLKQVIDEKLGIDKNSPFRKFHQYTSQSATAREVNELVEQCVPLATKPAWKIQGSTDINRKFIPTVLARYPETAIRTLLALSLSCYGKEQAYALEGLINMGKIPDIKKTAVFGASADYRELSLPQGQRVTAEIGARTFGSLEEQLGTLGKDELIRAITLLLHENDVLSEILFDKEKESAERFRESYATEYNNVDPLGYYSVLEINPETMWDMSDEQATLTLKRHFNRLIQIHHPDKGGDPAMTRRLLDARNFLEDSQNRKSYGKKVRKGRKS